MFNNKNFIPQELDKPKFFETVGYSYLTTMGSRAYGTETPESDYDFYGFTVPPLEIIFPHLNGYIQGFGRTYSPFEQYQQQHVSHPVYGEVDFSIYNIVKYFHLVMLGNPNMVDSLFVNDESILFMDEVGKLVRDNRKLFLSQKMYHTFKGMAYSHLSRIKSGHIKEGRIEKSKELGLDYDVKDAYHTLRMLLQLLEVLETGELHLKANSIFLNDVRSGKYTLQYIMDMFDDMLGLAEQLVNSNQCAVPYSPDEKKLKNLLINCIEIKYGSLKFIGFGY